MHEHIFPTFPIRLTFAIVCLGIGDISDTAYTRVHDCRNKNLGISKTPIPKNKPVEMSYPTRYETDPKPCLRDEQRHQPYKNCVVLNRWPNG